MLITTKGKKNFGLWENNIFYPGQSCFTCIVFVIIII